MQAANKAAQQASLLDERVGSLQAQNMHVLQVNEVSASSLVVLSVCMTREHAVR